MAFKHGNLVRVSIKNFLTFDNVAIYPKPYLNLIIGPNGTGKSTYLCAICICLGGKPDVTGRSKSIDSFVKHGKEYATVEVEIFDDDGTNKVIRREFGKGLSKFSYQGKTTSKKEIDTIVERFSIQIDNLCTFLPQDRVANFSKMNSVQLLEATEQAVGEPNLYKWHETLRNSCSSMMNAKTTLTSLTNEMETLQRQNASMKDIVENVREKQKIEEEIKFYEQQKTFHTYECKRHEVIEVERILKKQTLLIKKEQSEIEPFRQEIENSKKINKVKQSDLNQKIINYQRSSDKCHRICNQIEEVVENIKCVSHEFQSKKEEEELRQREVQDYRRQLDALKLQLENMPFMDGKKFKEKIQNIDQEISRLSTLQCKIQTEKGDMEQQLSVSRERIRRCQQEINATKDVMRQRMQLLRQRNQDAYRAAEWIQDNAGIFRSPFYLPICTLLNIKDPRYASIVESSINFNDLIAFIFEDKDDMNKFKSIMDKKRIRVNILHSSVLDLSSFRPPVSSNQLKQMGFEMYMSEVIDAPPAVLSYLYKNNNIFRIPISSREDINYENLPDKISQFFMGRLRVIRSRSRYDGECMTESSEIREGTLLKITLDVDRIKALEQEIVNNEQSTDDLRERDKQLDQRVKEVKEEIDNLKNEKQGYLSRKQQRSTLENRIRDKEKQIQRKESIVFDEREERRVMQETITESKNLLKRHLRSLQELGVDVDSTNEFYKIKSEMKLRKIFNDNMLEKIKYKEEEIKKLQADYENVAETRDQVKIEAKALLSKLLGSLNVKHASKLDNELLEKFRSMDKEETEKKLNELEVQRDCIHTADEEEIRDYNEREAQIARLQEELDSLKLRNNDKNKKVKEIKTRWLPAITDLITNISESFTTFMERMGCSGQVELMSGEDEDDYTKYGISIMVKFRGANKLRQLTAQHQSGGERAVSTALYMLSLQSLTKVPFRCVDEINQGMDPVNERKMLSMMMETAASEESSQYFFVSPKLLPDLEYNDKVNTITVYNGNIAKQKIKLIAKEAVRRKKKLAAR